MEYFKRLGNFWFPNLACLLWLLMGLPALYFLQTTVHEGTHAMAALIVTGHGPKFAPFPHEHSDGQGGTYFLNGVTYDDPKNYVEVRTRDNCDTENRVTEKHLAGFPAAPQFLDFILIVVFSLFFAFIGFSSPIVRFPLRMLYLGFWIDFMYNTMRGLIAGCKETTDWSKFYLQSDMSIGVFAFITWLLWLLILSHFVWVYWSAWGREPVDRAGFWDYRWVAFIFGILSLICVIASIAVNDDAIHKGTAAFIIPFIIQVLALIWYGTYFGLSFKYSNDA